MKRVFFPCLLFLAVLMVGGCAQTMKAIEHAKMTTNVKMSETFFLDPEQLVKNRKVYVRVTNTSQLPNITFADDLMARLRAKGYEITANPSEAGYLVQANVLYMDYQREGSLTADGMLAGGFGGAVTAAAMSRGNKTAAVAAAAAGVVGSLAGAAIGAVVHVDTFIGTVDVQIKERVQGGVTGEMVTETKQGSSATLKTTRKVKSDFQIYQTRIVATATRTNINKEEASMVLSQEFARQIAGLF